MSAYQSLCEVVSEISLLTSMEAVLSWDQETYMPSKALDFRARQMSYLTGKAHALLTSAKTRKLLDKAETEMPETPTQAANVRGLRRDIDRATKLPAQLVQEESETATHAKAA